MVIKRIYEELKVIENKANEICQYVEPKERIENGIVIKTFFPIQSNRPTRVSFELDYHDWLKLQKSKEWKDFEKLFLKYQKRHNQQSLKVRAN